MEQKKTLSNRFNAVVAKPYEVNGENRTQWVKVGRAAQFSDGSVVLNIDCLPTGQWWDGTIQLFVQQDQQQQGQAQTYLQQSQYQQQQPQAPQGGEGDLPF